MATPEKQPGPPSFSLAPTIDWHGRLSFYLQKYVIPNSVNKAAFSPADE
jgi:hypothetical protein